MVLMVHMPLPATTPATTIVPIVPKERTNAVPYLVTIRTRNSDCEVGNKRTLA